jgi:hypothetical protein
MPAWLKLIMKAGWAGRGCRGGVCAWVSVGCGPVPWPLPASRGTGEKSQVKGLEHKKLSGIVLEQQHWLGVVVSWAEATAITSQRCSYG